MKIGENMRISKSFITTMSVLGFIFAAGVYLVKVEMPVLDKFTYSSLARGESKRIETASYDHCSKAFQEQGADLSVQDLQQMLKCVYEMEITQDMGISFRLPEIGHSATHTLFVLHTLESIQNKAVSLGDKSLIKRNRDWLAQKWPSLASPVFNEIRDGVRAESDAPIMRFFMGAYLNNSHPFSSASDLLETEVMAKLWLLNHPERAQEYIIPDKQSYSIDETKYEAVKKEALEWARKNPIEDNLTL